MARLVVCASPLVKIYLPEWHDRLEADPDLMYDDKDDFKFDVVSGCSSFKVDFNKPMSVNAKPGNSSEALFLWLIGESAQSAQETDIYGLVPFEPGIDLVQRTDEISRLESLYSDDPEVQKKAREEIAKISRDTSSSLKVVRQKARVLSEQRIRRAMKLVHNNLIRQWQVNEEMKLGKYPASMTEKFGTVALHEELEAAAAKGAKLNARMNKIMNLNINV